MRLACSRKALRTALDTLMLIFLVPVHGAFTKDVPGVGGSGGDALKTMVRVNVDVELHVEVQLSIGELDVLNWFVSKSAGSCHDASPIDVGSNTVAPRAIDHPENQKFLGKSIPLDQTSVGDSRLPLNPLKNRWPLRKESLQRFLEITGIRTRLEIFAFGVKLCRQRRLERLAHQPLEASIGQRRACC